MRQIRLAAPVAVAAMVSASVARADVAGGAAAAALFDQVAQSPQLRSAPRRRRHRRARARPTSFFLRGTSRRGEEQVGAAVAPCSKSFRRCACRSLIGVGGKARLQAEWEAHFERFERVEVAALTTARMGAGKGKMGFRPLDM